MGLILRTSSLANPGNSITVKGSALTYAEGDGNFMYLLTNMSGSTISITGSTGILGDLTATGDITFTLSNSNVPNIVSYNPSTGRLFYQTTSSFSVGTASYILSSGVDGPLGTGSVSNSLFASSSLSASYAAIASFAPIATTSSTSSLSLQALTASYVALQAGPGITTNGIAVTASVRSVNGNFPDFNGNIQTALVSTVIGTSASLQISSSGAITGSLSDGLVWIIAGDPDPNNNGDTYIFSLGTTSGSWYPISTLDTTAGDARYLKLTPQSPLSGSLNMGGNNITNIGTLQGTSSWASRAITASYALNSAGGSISGTTNKIPKFTGASTLGNSNITDDGTTLTMTNNIVIQDPNNPSLIYIGGTNSSMYLDASYGGGTAVSSIIRQSIGNQAKLVFGTGNTASVDWSMGTTNNTGNSDFKIAAGDIYTPESVALSISSSRYVGINRTSPEYNLHVSGTVSFTDLTTGSVSNIVMINTTTGQLFYTSSAAIYSQSLATSPIATNGTTLYSINPSAGVGGSSTGSIFLGIGAGNYASTANNSNFIGKSAGVSASSAYNSNFLGLEAGFSASDAYYSNFIGLTAGYQATNADNSNFLGVGVGYQATNAASSNFLGNQAGYQATNANNSNFIGTTVGYEAAYADLSNFIGYNAGYQSFSASLSNFLGYQAGSDAEKAIRSNFIGYSAGQQATNASQSNFIGDSAGFLAENAIYSNFLGYQAGYQATNVQFSNFLNYQAGYQATNVQYSNFLGYQAGYGAASASYSSFLGNGAGANALNASASIFIGPAAGYNAASASFSIIIGYNAGVAASTATSIGRNNIILGTNITLPTATANSLNIGGILFGTGLYSTSSGAPSSGSAGGKIGINIISPQYSLDVSGSGNFNNGIIVTGSTTLSGSTTMSGSLFILGSLSATSFTGSFSGTVSTASYILSSNVYGPSGANSISTSSYALYSLTSSYIQGGTLNYVPLWSGNNVLTSSLIYQNSSFIGIGTTSAAYTLDVSGSGRFTNGIVVTGSTTLSLTTGSALQNIVLVDTASGQLYYTSSTAVSTATLTGGAANRIPLWSSTSALTTSSFFQSGSNILLGATSSTTANALHIIGSGSGTGFRYTGRDNLNYVLLEDGAVTGSGTSFVASFYKSNDNTVALLNLTPGSSSLVSTDLLTLNSNIANVQGDVFTYIGDYEGNANNIYIEVDQADNAVYIPSGSVGIGKTSSLNAKLDILGDVIITGSLIAASSSLSNFLRIIPSNPLPTASQGAIAVSGSGVQCKPYFYNGSSWNPFYNELIISSSLNVDDLTVDGVMKASGSNVGITGSLSIQSGSGDFYIYGHKQYNYGAFQTNYSFSGSANVSSSMPISVTDEAVGISIISGSRMTFANAGTYNIQFSAQLVQTGAATVYIWLKKNGTNIAGSAGKLSLANGESTITAWNYISTFNANDYVELAWQGDTAGGTVFAYQGASGNIPIVPALIVTAIQVR